MTIPQKGTHVVVEVAIVLPLGLPEGDLNRIKEFVEHIQKFDPGYAQVVMRDITWEVK